MTSESAGNASYHTQRELIFKVFDVVASHKYVFVGTLPREVTRVLHRIATPSDVLKLPVESVHMLNTAIPDWEYRLGLHVYHPHTSITSSTDYEESISACKALLRASGIRTYSDIEKISKGEKRYSKLLNCAKRVYGHERSLRYTVLAGSRPFTVSFVPYAVHPDDTVFRLKQKVTVAASEAIALRKDLTVPLHKTQYLWFDRTIVGFSREGFPVNPFENNLLSKSSYQTHNATHIVDTTHVNRQADYVLQDIGLPSDAEYNLVTLAGMLSVATRMSLNSVDRSALVKRYYPNLTKSPIDVRQVSPVDIDSLTRSLKQEQNIFDSIYLTDGNAQTQRSSISVHSSVIDVPVTQDQPLTVGAPDKLFRGHQQHL